MATSATRTREPILGYEVTERIGAGGYGEVWKATAPGGLTKAIKFVYGYLDDERARRELKALSRVKLVRHPFLLSLERIEVVDGQLVIVTELADMSLKDRHDQCKAAGMVGIPRDELLGYLRDAADALDYMRDKYSLQHLDVKPENLLLVAGHVKVADFGLVKDIDDTRASMMGGLTPIYASPEVFDDRPSQCSDQYSLAIVYQEMLTDTLPFPGKTTAQLAAQHLQSRPRLTALPPDDKPIIDRALSKDPAARFGTARAMVDALTTAGRSPAEAKPAGTVGGETTPLAIGDTHQARPAAPVGPLPETSTQMLDGGTARQEIPSSEEVTSATCVSASDKGVPEELIDSGAATALNGHAAKSLEKPLAPAPAKESGVAAPHRRPRAKPVVHDLPPLNASLEAAFRPLLMVGVGGTARLVVNQLERRLADRFGDLQKLPALKMLAFDTDPSDVAADAAPERTRSVGEFLAMPLRKPEDYRHGSTKFLAWMSRRWLYNIPRSLETEGLRPLGRLAMVDHAEPLVEQLTAALDAITAAAAIEASAGQTGLPAGNNAPRLMLVASICGGTGGGMALDVAYLLRRLLRDRGLPDDCLSVLLLHWSRRNASAHELAVANTFGVLSELAHFCEHGYPGEPSLGLPPSSPSDARLPGMYLVNLGDELGEHDLPGVARSVADYLFLSSTAVAGSWLDAARRESSDPAADGRAAEPALRTFGVCRLGAGDEVVATAADDACGALLALWCGTAPDGRDRQAAASGHSAHPAIGTSSSAETDRLTSERIALLGLSLDHVTEQLEQAAASGLGGDVDAFLQELTTQAAAVPLKSPATGGFDDEMHPQLAALDRVLGLPASGADPTVLVTALETHMRETSRQHGAALRAWVVELTNNHRVRLAGAARAMEEISRHVRELRDTAQKVRAKTGDELRSAAGAVIGGKSRSRLWPARGSAQASPAEQQSRLLHYASLKFMDTVFASAVKYAQMLTWELSTIAEQLSETRRELSRLATLFAHDDARRREAHASGAAAVDAALREIAQQRLPEIVAQLDEEFERELIAPRGGLSAALAGGKDFREQLIAALRTRSRAAVLSAVRSATVARGALEENESPGSEDELLRSCLAEAMPELAMCGGNRRLLVLTNRPEDVAALAEGVTRIAGHAPSVVVDSANDPALCYEVAGLPLWEVAASLVDGQPHCAALASRLHTRCDIEWTPLALPE
ncbi:MAG TPA: tubulin-like doman-containing protein [Pirellulales bacterium]|nr:tubulin-like doman-containing protein [Pirellulales bacterium]